MLPNVTVGRPRAVLRSASTAAGQNSRTQEEEAYGEVGLVTEEKSQASLTQGTSGSSAGTWHAHLLRAELVLQP